jgi:hypothetical protein
LPVLLIAGAAATLLALGVLVRGLHGAGDASGPPARSRPPIAGPAPAKAYDERLDGERYENRDLGLSITGPRGWTASLGARAEDARSQEGLLVKMRPEGAPDPTTGVRPLLSVVKRAAGPGDPVSYIRSRLLSGGKIVLEPPTLVELKKGPAGRVVYEMASGGGTIRIVQHVFLRGQEAIIISAMAPSAAFDGLRRTFDQVAASVEVRS